MLLVHEKELTDLRQVHAAELVELRNKSAAAAAKTFDAAAVDSAAHEIRVAAAATPCRVPRTVV